MRVSWVTSITIVLNLFTSCSVQPSLSEDKAEDKIELPLIGEEVEDEPNNLFHQDLNKSYSQIDRSWVLAKPLLEFNNSNSSLLEDE